MPKTVHFQARPEPCQRTFNGQPLFYDAEIEAQIAERTGPFLAPDDMGTRLACENLALLLRTCGAIYEQLTALLAPYGLSVAKYNLLILLKAATENRLPMSEIGERMSVTCANITKLVDGLEREGLVRRTNLPGDRRVVLAVLTPEGEALLERIMPSHLANVRRLWAGMEAPDCLQLTHLLIKLRQSV